MGEKDFIAIHMITTEIIKVIYSLLYMAVLFTVVSFPYLLKSTVHVSGVIAFIYIINIHVAAIPHLCNRVLWFISNEKELSNRWTKENTI